MDGNINNPLISDRDIAEHLSMSKSWVRQQRLLRRRGEPHFLTIDPVMIGTSPRYRVEDLDALLNEVFVANDNAGGRVER
jgi:hypothetical protein